MPFFILKLKVKIGTAYNFLPSLKERERGKEEEEKKRTKNKVIVY